MVCGRRLVRSMLFSPWHNMHAQWGSELGNTTADEHSGTLMRAYRDRTSRSRRTAANLSLIGDQLVEFLLATAASRHFPSVFLSVHSRFPIQGQPLPESPPSATWAASSRRHPFVTGSRDELTTNPRGNRKAFVLGLGLTKKCRTEGYFCPTFFCQQRLWSTASIQLMVHGRRLVRSMLVSPRQHARPVGE
jgi:hypothetical protein